MTAAASGSAPSHSAVHAGGPVVSAAVGVLGALRGCMRVALAALDLGAVAQGSGVTFAQR